MSAILVLLALLAVSTLASRKGAAAFVVTIITTPLLLGIGFLLSARGLAFLPQTTADALLPAIRVGAAWLAVLVGLRAARPRFTARGVRRTAGTLVVCIVTWGALTGGVFGVLLLLDVLGGSHAADSSHLTALGAALLLGGIVTGSGYQAGDEGHEEPMHAHFVVFLSRHDEITGAVAILVAIVLWPLDAPVYGDSWLAPAVILGLALTMTVANLLIGGVNQDSTANARIALLGQSVFASGLATAMGLPDAAIAFFFGAFLAFTPQAMLQLERGLLATERPVRMAVLALVGAHLGFTWEAVAIGVSLALLRLGVKMLLRPAVGGNGAAFPLHSFLSSSGLAIPFAVSFAMTRPGGLSESFVLTAVCVAVSVSDLITFALWRRPPAPDVDVAVLPDAPAPGQGVAA